MSTPSSRSLFAVPALLAGVPAATLAAAMWSPAVWGLPTPDQSGYPELSFTNATVAANKADIAVQACPRHESVPRIWEGNTVALHVRRQSGIWPKQTIPLDFEILRSSTADASDFGTRKTLQNVSLTFPATAGAGPSIAGCVHIDLAEDGKLEGKEVLSLRLKPKLGSYRVKSGGDRQSMTIWDDQKSKIRVKYKDVGKLGGLPSQRRFTVELEAGDLSVLDTHQNCTFTRDSSFSGSVKLTGWKVAGAAGLEDFEDLPSSVRFSEGVARIQVRAKMDGDRGEESFSIRPDRATYTNGEWVGGLRGLVMLCESPIAAVPNGAVGPSGVIGPAQSAPAKPTGLSATSSEDRVNLSWTASADETITGWRYRLRSKGLSDWGSAVAIPSSGAATRTHAVDASTWFGGIVTEFQVQSYSAAGDSPWSEAATATVVNGDKPVLSISKSTVTVEEGDSESWTVRLNGAVAGTVSLSLAESSPGAAVTLSPSALTFTAENAQTPRTVRVSGDDAGTFLFQGEFMGEVVVNHAFTLAGSSITTVAEAGSVEVIVTEAALSISKSSVTVKEGETATWKVSLNSAVAGTVSLSLAESSPGAAVTLSPSALTFTAENGQTPQTVRVTGDNAGDMVFDGKRTGAVVVNHAFTPAGSSTPRVANGGSVEVIVEGALKPVNVAPVLEAIADVAVTAGEAVEITASATDADGDTVNYTWSRKAGETPALPQGTALNQARLRFTPTAAGVYTMTVTAEDGNGGAATEEVEIRVSPLSAPAAPKKLRARPGNGQVTLEWADPSDESIVKYEVRQRLARNGRRWDGWRQITGSGAETVSHVVSSLSNGQKYIFQVRAVNAGGEGEASSAKGATPMDALTVAVEDGRLVEGDNGKKEMAFKVRLSGETVHDVKLQATAMAGPDSTATGSGNARDFVPLSQAVVFAAYGREHRQREEVNDLVQTVRVEVVGDHLAEGDETFLLRLDALESEDKRVTLVGGGEKTTATGVITDDDAAPVLAALADVAVTTGQEVDITASATDADGDAISYTWSRKAGETTPVLPQGTVVNQAKLTFTPTQAGEYTMRVAVDDGHGNTDSKTVVITVGAAVVSAPSKPTGLAASGGNRQVSLTWDNPGNANISKWQLRQKVGSGSWGSWEDISGSGAGTVSHTVKGLTNGTPYGFKVRAVAGTAEGVASEEVSATPTVAVMAPRLTVTPQHGGDSCPVAAAKWTVTDTNPGALVKNADSITGWTIQYRKYKSSGEWWPWLRMPQFYPPNDPTNAATRSRGFMACVPNGSRMQFRVRAVGQRQGKGQVSGPWSNVETVTFTTDHQGPVPNVPKPTGLKAAPGNRKVTLTWEQPRYNIISWQIQQKAGSGNWGSWEGISGSNHATVSHTVTGLTNGTSYAFRIRALRGKSKDATEATIYRGFTSPSSEEVSATPKGAMAPTLTVTTRDQAGCPCYHSDLVWTVTDTAPHALVENADRIVGWTVHYRLKGATRWEGFPISTSNAATRSYTHNARQGTEMEYRVRADGARQGSVSVIYGPWSNVVTAKLETAPSKPTGVTAYGGNGQALLRWDNPGDASISKWQVQQDGGSWVDVSIDRTTPRLLEHKVRGLSNGVSYGFKVRAVGGVAGEASDEVRATAKGVTAPNLTATTRANSDGATYSVDLMWTVADTAPHAIVENAERITGWAVYYRLKGAMEWTGLDIPNSNATTRSYTHTAKKGRDMEYRVRATGTLQNTVISGDASYSNTVRVGVAKTPTGFTAQAGDGEVTLSWDNPGEEYVTDYQVRQKAEGGSWGEWTSIRPAALAAIKLSEEGTVSYTISALSNGTLYGFRLRAVNGAGYSEEPAHVEATPTKSKAVADGETPQAGVPPVPEVKIDPGRGRQAKICTAAAPKCDYRSGGAWKAVWSIDFGPEGAQHYTSAGPITALQIQYTRSDRPQDGVSEWINTGWGPGEAYDGYISTPWPGMVSNRRRSWWGFIYYEQVPYEISMRVRLVNANGSGPATGWYTFTPGSGSYAREQTYLPGTQQVSVSDATVKEGENAQLSFKVTLARAQAGVVNVKYATRDGTATAGADYSATSGVLTFAPGEREKTVNVAVLDDSHDETSETMELVLSEISGPLYPTTALSNIKGTGTITNTDPMPSAWLGRFGRTVADHALDAVSKRIAAEQRPGLSGSLVGQSLPDMTFGSGVKEEDVVSDATGSDGTSSLAEAIYHAATASGSMSSQDMLLGTNFSLTRGADATGGNLTFWGRATYSGFDGKEENLSLDGEVTTGLLGMDYARQRWLLGLSISRSGGNGSYNGGDAGDGKIEVSLTSAVPYGSWQASERLKLWGAMGYGMGEMTLKPNDKAEITADLDWTMAAVGARAALLDPDGQGLSLDLLSDALWSRTTSEKVTGMDGTEAEVSRLRLGLEGSWRNLLQGGGELTPKFSLGARLDGGNAETGFGMEVGGGMAWSSPGLGLSLDLDGRTLLFHEADGLRDWGFSAGLVFDPDPDSERGLSVTLGQDWGGEATGGLDALFASDPLAQRTGAQPTSRWKLEAAYGLPVFSGYFTGSPYVGLALAAGTRDYTIGWRLTPAVDGVEDLSVEVKATRSESNNAWPDHGVGLELQRTW